MPSTKFKKRNLSRYKKTYPFVQRTPRWGLVSDKDVIFEIKDLKFDNELVQTYWFAEIYTSVPIVTATVKEPDDNDAFDSASVSAMIKDLNTESVTIELSERITGSVQIHIIFIKE